ncbi:MAG: hypothetical protein Q8N99_08020 [Nanoarchaeota archaeon]|nr:hypothetical protein [Nanoarchaeota archaeon]
MTNNFRLDRGNDDFYSQRFGKLKRGEMNEPREDTPDAGNLRLDNFHHIPKPHYLMIK